MHSDPIYNTYSSYSTQYGTSQPYMAPDATALNANGCKTIPFEVWLLVLTRLKSECIFAKLDNIVRTYVVVL